MTPAITGPAPKADGTRILVTVGTDHHPFDRLIRWVNDWIRANPGSAETVFVQSGTASVAPACPAADFLGVHRLGELLDSADVHVCHGGPGAIADAWQRGHVPVVVPRLRKFGEVVDDHQLDFCVKLAELEYVRLALGPEELARHINEACSGQPLDRITELGGHTDAAIERFGVLVEELASRPRRRPSLFNLAKRTLPGTGEVLRPGRRGPGRSAPW